jgi:hypothetical protein
VWERLRELKRLVLGLGTDFAFQAFVFLLLLLIAAELYPSLVR